MRIKGWMGRADQTTKIKGMFVRPEQVAALVAKHPDMTRARVIADRSGETDVMSVQCVGVNLDATAIATSLPAILKLNGEVVVVPNNTIPRDGIVIEDRRSYET
jgi:phenylacetate-CoA ligase